MNPEVKRLWLEALRSGDYKQGAQRLRWSESTYCCLGVLCEISGVGEWKTDKAGTLRYSTRTDEPGNVSTTPDEVSWWAGLPFFGEDSSTGFLRDNPQQQLAKMNDELPGFDVIADWIEENL